jgi:hypothetical protein
MSKKDDKIAKALDLTPMEPTNPRHLVIEPMQDDIHLDFQYTRMNLKQVIEQGVHALDEMIEIAKSSQQARAFEVVATLVSTLSNANKDLLDLNKKYKDLNDGQSSKGGVTNNLFVGSTTELLQMLKNKVEK